MDSEYIQLKHKIITFSTRHLILTTFVVLSGSNQVRGSASLSEMAGGMFGSLKITSRKLTFEGDTLYL